MKAVPEMWSAVPWVSNYFAESQLIATTVNSSDPTIGNLLDFGTATHSETTGRTANVAGFPCGDNGQALGEFGVIRHGVPS